MYKVKYPLILSLLAILVTACGGGADGSSTPTSGSSPSVTTDTTSPSVTITGPTSSSSYSTSSAALSLSGSASDNVGVTQVTWSNSRGGSGTASGTISWNASGITLQDGSNTLTVTARDAAGNTSTDTLVVTYSTSTPGDTTAPSVTITSPTSSSTYTTSSGTLALAGSASDNVGVTQVSWSNNRGGSGTASGTTSWSVGSITLQSGSNIITVTARDAANNQNTDVLTVTYNVADTTPPTISSTNPASGATNASTSGAITVIFSETMSAASINSSTFMVGGVSGSISVNGTTATLTPSSALATTTSYTVTVVGGAGGVKDAAGNALASNYSWSFTTSAPLACGQSTVLCVDDTAGASQEYSTIQAAVNVVRPGDSILVYDGTYSGFSISADGASSSRIVIKAEGSSAVINQTNSNGEGITLSNANYVSIEGFTITGMPNYGLATHNASATNPMRGLIIRNNTVQNSGSVNIYLSQVADSLVEGNTAIGSVASHGIYLSNGGSDNTILRNNRSYNNAKAGIHFNGDLSVGGDGYQTGLTVENNVIYGNSGNGLNMDGVGDSIIQNNLLHNNSSNAFRAFRIDAAQGPINLSIINNTFVTSSGWPVKLTADQGGHVFFNNILLNTGSNGSIVVSNVNFTSNNNIVMGSFSLDGENTTIDLAQWQSLGHDAGSQMSTSSALFANPESADYSLKTGSPAINAGRATLNGVAAPSSDILGVTRPQGGVHDIGAYESN